MEGKHVMQPWGDRGVGSASGCSSGTASLPRALLFALKVGFFSTMRKVPKTANLLSRFLGLIKAGGSAKPSTNMRKRRTPPASFQLLACSRVRVPRTGWAVVTST